MQVTNVNRFPGKDHPCKHAGRGCNWWMKDGWAWIARRAVLLTTVDVPVRHPFFQHPAYGLGIVDG
jgi:hypothetical protein